MSTTNTSTFILAQSTNNTQLVITTENAKQMVEEAARVTMQGMVHMVVEHLPPAFEIPLHLIAIDMHMPKSHPYYKVIEELTRPLSRAKHQAQPVDKGKGKELGTDEAQGIWLPAPQIPKEHSPYFQAHCFHLSQVDVAATDSAVHLTISFASPTTSFLNLNTCHEVLASAHHLNHSPKAIFMFCVSWASISVFCGTCTSFPSMLTCFCPSGYLAISISSSKVFRLFPLLCTSIRAVDTSACFPKPSTSPALCANDHFCIDLSTLCLRLCGSLATLRTRAHVFHASVRFSSLSGSPMRDTAPLAGTSGVANEFAAVHKSFATLCACVHASNAPV
ncbi:hypothetical protein F5J12DRAFT_963383 [Pisolithus orientalis]|uniref:uncharacterized protein n=1 Tax=Pisolithus orientalis TaxID=936130 RepID=UPI00222527AE|nr:uncharacterized protein F5J12DRAFT_963383 [Pisolithus orientalis]KAI5993751.1 hypothetical protein F5J12DRAFT_963383 [Pisolithus orientalis]